MRSGCRNCSHLPVSVVGAWEEANPRFLWKARAERQLVPRAQAGLLYYWIRMDGMSETQSGPRKPRYGEHTGCDRAEIAIQVRAADYNGDSFDGSPFSAMPDWLRAEIQCGRVEPHTRGHTDYAEWDVTTEAGPVTASPGDWIIRREKGDLSVVDERDAFILLNLRAPAREDADRDQC